MKEDVSRVWWRRHEWSCNTDSSRWWMEKISLSQKLTNIEHSAADWPAYGGFVHLEWRCLRFFVGRIIVGIGMDMDVVFRKVRSITIYFLVNLVFSKRHVASMRLWK